MEWEISQSMEEKLNEISEKQLIKRIKEFENGKSIEIIASEFPFSIELMLKDSEWKVNLDKIIELRTKNNCFQSNGWLRH